MPEKQEAPAGNRGLGVKVGDGDRLSVHDSATPPEAASRSLPFTPDPNERYCPHCQRVVIRRAHRSRCLARKAATP